MAGRNRSSARPPERAFVRLIAGGLALTAAIGLAITIPEVQRGIRHDSSLTADQTRDAAASDFKYSTAALELYRRSVHRGDRFYVDGRGPTGRFSPEVLDAFLSYYLLPAVRVVRRADATVVLHFRFLGKSSVERLR